MDSVASGGPHWGRTIWKNMRSSPAPSTLAASISASGIPEMNCLIRKTPMGWHRNGRINAAYVLARCMFEMMTNKGTNVATLGTMRVTMTAPNKIFLPANFILASA